MLGLDQSEAGTKDDHPLRMHMSRLHAAYGTDGD